MKKETRKGRRIWLRRSKPLETGGELDQSVLFESGGDGHYYSNDGRFAIFHMMCGTPHVCWELWTVDENRRHVDLIEGNGITLGDIVNGYELGLFDLPEDT